MKKIYIIFLIILFSAGDVKAYYDMSVPVEGKTIANEALQFKVKKHLYEKISPKNPTCSDFIIETTELLHYPYDLKKNKRGEYIKGYWQELWTVKYCGKKQQIPVSFNIKKRGTEFSIEENFIQ